MRGLDPPAGPKPLRRGEGPRIHLLHKNFSKRMDCRVKPGNDAWWALSRTLRLRILQILRMEMLLAALTVRVRIYVDNKTGREI